MALRRLCWQLVCLASLVCTPLASAQDAKIGYVDMKRLFDEAPQVQLVRDALDREFSPRNEALLADEQRLAEIDNQLATATDLSPSERQTLNVQSRNLARSIERRREDLAEEIRFRTNAETNALEQTIELAVSQVAQAGEYDLILTQPVAYASERVDITDDVLIWLSADLQANEMETP